MVINFLIIEYYAHFFICYFFYGEKKNHNIKVKLQRSLDERLPEFTLDAFTNI